MQHLAGEAVVKVAHPDDVQFVARRATLVADVEDRSCEDVIAELFHVEYAGLVRLAYVVLHDRCSAEDVVMEAFCSLHAHWSGCDASPRRWPICARRSFTVPAPESVR